MSEASGLTLVRYTRPLASSDISATSSRDLPIDKSINTTPGMNTFIVWALGPINEETGAPGFHSNGYAKQDGMDVSLDFDSSYGEFTSDILGKPGRVFVPFLEMSDSGDKVEWLS